MIYQHALCLYPYYQEPFLFDVFPPTGIEHIATALEGEVGAVTLIDLRREQTYRDVRQLLELIKQSVDLLCVSMNWTFHVDQVCNLLNLLPADITLIVGGQYATACPEELFQKCPHIRLIVRGEGEETIREIAQKKPAPDILGISYRHNGQIVHTPNRPLPPVETIRYPNRRLRRVAYPIRFNEINLSDAEIDTIWSSRGCPYHCQFCTLAINPLGQRRPYSARSPESVFQEISEISAEIIFFADDNFFVEPERVERICDLLLEKGIQKTFLAQARIELARYPASTLKKMEQAGFKALLLGVESPHDRVLQQFQKGFTAQDVRDAFQTFQKYAFFYLCFFIYGNIGETREEMLVIPEFAHEIGADVIWAQDLQVRQFSPLKTLVETTPGYAITPEGFVYSETYRLKELQQIGKIIARRFYTPAQVYRMIRKLYAIRTLPHQKLRFVVALLRHLPALLSKGLQRQIKKRRSGKKVGIPYA